MSDFESELEHWSSPDGCHDGCPACAEEQEHNETPKERKERERNARLVAAAPRLLAVLHDLAAAAARIVEDDAKPTMVHMRELNRQRRTASELISEIGIVRVPRK